MTDEINASPEPGTGTVPTYNFRDDLPDDLREHPSLAAIQDVAGLAKSYVNAQKMVGADKIVVPGMGASDEEWGQVYAKLGRPESPDKYQINKPPDLPEDFEYNEPLEQFFREAAHKAGLNTRQTQQIYGSYMSALMEEVQRQKSQRAEMEAANETALKREYGLALPQTIEANNRVISEFGGPEFAEKAKASGMDRDPDFVRFVSKVAKAMGEDRFVGRGAALQSSPKEALDSISKKLADPVFMEAYRSKMHPAHDAAVQEMYRLRQQAHPETTA